MARMIYHAATDKKPVMRTTKPKKRTPPKIDIRDREFGYSFFHVNTWAIRDLMNTLTPTQFQMIFQLCMITKPNSNVVMNVYGDPAGTKEEISSALGLIKFGRTLSVLKDRDIIRKDNKAYYLNPYVIAFGKKVDDYTYEIFTDSKWRMYSKSMNYGEADLP